MADASKPTNVAGQPVHVQVGVPHTGADPLGAAVPDRLKAEMNKTPDVKERERKAQEPHNPLMDNAPLPATEGLKLGPESNQTDVPGGGRKDDRDDMAGTAKGYPVNVPGGKMNRRPGEKHRKP